MPPARPRRAPRARRPAAETNRLRRRRAVPGHVPDLGADPRPLPAGAGPRRLRPWRRQHHQRAGRDVARGAPGPVLCRHGRGPLPGRAAAQRDGRPRFRRLPADRGRPHPCRRRQPARDRHAAAGRRGADPALAGHRRHRRWSRSTTGRSCSARASCPPSARCAWGRCMYRSGLVPRSIPLLGLARRSPPAGLRRRDPVGRLRPDSPRSPPWRRSRSPCGSFVSRPGSSSAGSARLHPRRIRRPSTTLSQEREPDPCQRDVDAD